MNICIVPKRPKPTSGAAQWTAHPYNRIFVGMAAKKRSTKAVALTDIDAKAYAAIKKLCRKPPTRTTSIEAVAGHSCVQPDIRESLGIGAWDTPAKQRLQRAIVRLTNAGKIGCLGQTRARVYYLTPTP